MTSGIRPYSGTDPSAEVASSSGGATANAAKANNSEPVVTQAAPSNEAVTLTENAQASSQLLAGARQAPGVDAKAVARLSTAVQNHSFSVPPDALASSIISAFNQIKP